MFKKVVLVLSLVVGGLGVQASATSAAPSRAPVALVDAVKSSVEYTQYYYGPGRRYGHRRYYAPPRYYGRPYYGRRYYAPRRYYPARPVYRARPYYRRGVYYRY